MTTETKNLLERHGLDSKILRTDEVCMGIIQAIGRLGLYKILLDVHTLYINAIKEVLDEDDLINDFKKSQYLIMAKMAVNIRRGKEIYKL